MKSLRNFFALLIIFILVLLFNYCVLGVQDEYVLVEELICKNNKKTDLKNGYVEISIGNKNITQYQNDGELKITPKPDSIREDEFGNSYIYYDMKGYPAGLSFKVTIERRVSLDTFVEDISTRADTLIDDENKLFLEPQTKVESDDAKIIAKAKELTYDMSSDYKKALAIFEYVNTELDYNISSQYANKGALSTLENEVGVCEDFAALFVALCRAIDIPARVVVGYDLETEDKIDDDTDELITVYSLIDHAWAEIYLEDYGWLPVEPTIIYVSKGERVPYLNAFCKLEEPNHIATGLYNADEASVVLFGMSEVSYESSIVPYEEAEDNTFTDLTSDWYKESINDLYKLGIVNGYPDGTYGPQKNVSRIEFMCMLSRTLDALDYQVNNSGMVYYHLDYDKEHYSKKEYDYLMRCFQTRDSSDIMSAGYMTLGTVFGTSIDMDRAITREEVVALVDVFLKEGPSDNVFSDIGNSNFKSSILKSYSNGLILGYPNGTFKPKGEITRAEMAMILNRYIKTNSLVL